MKKIWCVIPVYNNAMTVHTVVRQCLRELPDVLVVDDGSTDTDLAAFYASSRPEVGERASEAARLRHVFRIEITATHDHGMFIRLDH